MVISIEAEVSGVRRALEGTGRGVQRGAKAVVRAVARGTVKAIKGGIRATTKRRTGELLKAYGYRTWRNGAGATVRPKGANGSRIFPKVFSLNYGRKGTRMLPRHFVQKGEAWAQQGSNWEAEAEKIISREIARYWGRQ